MTINTFHRERERERESNSLSNKRSFNKSFSKYISILLCSLSSLSILGSVSINHSCVLNKNNNVKNTNDNQITNKEQINNNINTTNTTGTASAKLFFSSYKFINGILNYSYNENDNTLSISCSSTSNDFSVEDGVFKDSIDIPDAGITNAKIVAFPNNAFFSTSTLKPTCEISGSLILPNTLETIGRRVFYNFATYNSKPITSVDLSKCASLTKIGLNAFYSCGLTSISLPSSLTTIEDSAFNGCTIKQVNFEGNDTYKWVNNVGQGHLLSTSDEWDYQTSPIGCLAYGDIDMSKATDLSEIKANQFNGCAGVTSVNLPNSITAIEPYAFGGCSELTSINLSNCTSLAAIDQGAFQRCTGLTSISLPSSLTTITTNAFSNCPIQQVNFEGNDTYKWVNNVGQGHLLSTSDEWDYQTSPIGCLAYGDIDMSKATDLSEIKAGLFYNCAGVTSIDLSKCTSLTSIGTCAFYLCGLTSVSLPSSLTSIGSQAFYNCKELKTLDLSSCTLLETIDDNVFTNCSGLTSLDLSKCESLKNINRGAFYGCTALTSLDLSNCTALTTIGDSAFKYCSGLSSISLPSSLTSIETNAFAGCTGVSSIKIPNTITSIQNGAFMTNVDERTFLDSNINIYLNWNESDFNEFDFNNTLVWPVVYDNPTSPTKMFFPSKSTFYVPKGLTDVYLANKEKLGWDLNVEGLPYTVNDTQIKEYDPDNPGGKTTNLPLILGLSLGLGIPALAGIITGIVIGIKKYKKSSKKKKH